MELERARRFLSALDRIGYKHELRPDNIDQLFQNHSTSAVLQTLTEWMLHDCPDANDLDR